jgi:diacylglycerol kinase (ATP)
VSKKRTLIDSFNNAIEGIIYVLRTQRNMQWHFLIAFIILLSSVFLGVRKEQFIVLLFAITFVLAAELINTAIESAIDVVSTTYDPLAKIAKDVAASAVLLASINAVVVGVLVFHDKLNKWTTTLVYRLRSMDLYITVASLFIVLILVVVIKTFRGQHNFLSGGWVSGHSALAFSLLTAIVFISKSGLIFILGLIMALLVGQSRIETKIHTAREVAVGAILGFLVTVIVFQVFYGRALG